MNTSPPEPEEQNQSAERSESPRDGWIEWFKAQILPGLSVLLPKWAIPVAVLALIIIAAWRLSTATFDLSGFQFTDLLMLLMAFFAIAMSAAFYFKATDASNRFYDNTYKFTREIALILARIEERFGERLEHLHESYTGIQKQVEKAYAGAVDLDKLKEQIKEEEEKKKSIEEEKQKVIDELTEKAQLDEAEKRQIRDRLARAEMKAEEATRELTRLHAERAEAEAEAMVEEASLLARDGSIILYLRRGAWHEEVMSALVRTGWVPVSESGTRNALISVRKGLSHKTRHTVELEFGDTQSRGTWVRLGRFIHDSVVCVESPGTGSRE